MYRDIAVARHTRPEGVENAGNRSGSGQYGIGHANLDAVGDERRGDRRGSLVEQPAGRGFGRFDVGLIERVDSEQASGDRGGIFPYDELGAEGTAHEHLAVMVLEEVELRRVIDESHDLQILWPGFELGGDGQERDREDARPLLSGGLGDQLLDPLGQPDDVGPVRDEPELVPARLAAGDRGRENERGVPGVVNRDFEQRGLGFIEQLDDVDPGQSGGNQPEGGQRRVSTADRGVGRERAIARGAGCRLEGRAGVGDDHDALRRIDADVSEGRVEGPECRVGLDGRPRLARDDQHRSVEAARLGITVDGGEHLPRRRGVEDRQRNAGRLRDDLRCEGGAAHAGEHDAGRPVRHEFLAQGEDLGDERTRCADGLDPPQPAGRLSLRRGTPQTVVTGRQGRGDEARDETRKGPLDRLLDMSGEVEVKAHLRPLRPRREQPSRSPAAHATTRRTSRRPRPPGPA